jgi:hypothetical protein
MIKIDIWQVGYPSKESWKVSNPQNAVCIHRGYLELDTIKEGWQEIVWDLLNWSCWNYDDEGNAVKPENVHSPLAVCNDDIILQAEGSDKYFYAEFIGFEEANSLTEAVNALKDGRTLWPLRN